MDQQGVVSQGPAGWLVSQLGVDMPQDIAHIFSQEVGSAVGSRVLQNARYCAQVFGGVVRYSRNFLNTLCV